MATQYSVTSGATLVANTADTLLELATSATAGLTIIQIEICSAATAAGMLLLELGTYATTGNGTAITPLKWGTGQGVAANITHAKGSGATEPTTFTVGTLPYWRVPLPGMYSIILPFGRELFQPASTNRAFRATSTLAVATHITVVFEVG